MSKEQVELIDDLVDILYADKIEIREFVRESLLKDNTIDSMAHIIKVKNKEMRELSTFLKERNIPLIDLSPLVTVMDHVQELEGFMNKADESLVKSGKQIMKLTDEKAELEYQNKRYREALKFYANENNHVFWEDIREGENFVQLPISETDKGYKARKALEESE